MKYLLSLILLFYIGNNLSAQYVYTIKADSVLITACDSAELIIENHTQHIQAFFTTQETVVQSSDVDLLKSMIHYT